MSVASGARVTLIGQWFRLVIQVTGFIVLARLLSPDDFGLFAMVASVVAFAALFADSGLSLAALQAESLSDGQKSSLFLVNALSGLLGGLVVAASGPLLAFVYGDGRVVGIAFALASSVMLASLAVQFRVELNRAGRFSVISVQDITASAVGLACGVCAATSGLEYWSLVIQVIAQSATITLMAFGQTTWRPGSPAAWADVKALVFYGNHNLAIQLLNLTSRTVDVVAIGQSRGPVAVGLYSRASQLISMVFQQVVSPLTRVVLPRLSAADSAAEFLWLLERLQVAIVYALLGILSGMAAVATPMLAYVLGEDWRGAGHVLRILAVGAAFAALSYVYYWALLAKARTSLLLIAEVPGRALMIIGATLVSGRGPEAVAGAIAVGQVVIYVVGSIVMRSIGVDAVALAKQAIAPLCVVAVAFGISVSVQATVSGDVRQFWLGSFAWVATFSASLLLPSVRRSVRMIAALALKAQSPKG